MSLYLGDRLVCRFGWSSMAIIGYPFYKRFHKKQCIQQKDLELRFHMFTLCRYVV
jgi:hypothetical protein